MSAWTRSTSGAGEAGCSWAALSRSSRAELASLVVDFEGGQLQVGFEIIIVERGRFFQIGADRIGQGGGDCQAQARPSQVRRGKARVHLNGLLVSLQGFLGFVQHAVGFARQVVQVGFGILFDGLLEKTERPDPIAAFIGVDRRAVGFGDGMGRIDV